MPFTISTPRRPKPPPVWLPKPIRIMREGYQHVRHTISAAICSSHGHRHRYACFFGRPPLAPFARAAAALAGDVALPPAAPSCAAIQRLVP